MNKYVNFADNIYILFTRVRMLRELLVIEADPELFLDKTLDDIDFIDNTLNILLTELSNNNKLIEREELLSHLSELELQFGQILSEFPENGKFLPENGVPAINERIAVFRARSFERQKITDAKGSADDTEEPVKTNEPLVSSNELTELLKDF